MKMVPLFVLIALPVSPLPHAVSAAICLAAILGVASALSLWWQGVKEVWGDEEL